MKDYFERKAEEIQTKIHSALTVENMQKMIEMGLREVAKDQRHACIDQVNSIDGKYFGVTNVHALVTLINHNIMNCNLDSEEK